MVRRPFIENQILNIYKALPNICFPLDIQNIIDVLPNCRLMSYQKFAEINQCTVEDVIQICESQSGCTMYDKVQDRYLILYNQSTTNNNNLGRQRWTCCHEIGHIICKHHIISGIEQLSENNVLNISLPKFESEADYFAAVMLAPFPLFQFLGIKYPADVKRVFGLSTEASQNRFNDYQKWLHSHIKTSWENDMVLLYKSHTSKSYRP